MREKLREVLEFNPGSEKKFSKLTKLMNHSIIFIIFLSIISILFEYHYSEKKYLFYRINIFFLTIFSLEYLLRLYASKDRIEFIKDKFSLIDLIVIIVDIMALFMGAIFLNNIRNLRMLRLIRLIRVFRVFRYINFSIWLQSKKEKHHLGSLTKVILMTIGVWVLATNILYSIETNRDYFNTYWDILVILISGMDVESPTSFSGKVEVGFILFLGIIIISFVEGEIISFLMEKRKRKEKVVLLPKNVNLRDHIVIINKNSSIDNIIQEVSGAYDNHYYVIIVAKDSKELPILDKTLYKKVFAIDQNLLDYTDLDNLSLDKAKSIIVLPEEGISDDNRTLLYLMSVVNNLKMSDSKVYPMITVEVEGKSSKYIDILENDSKIPISFIDGSLFTEKLIANAVINKNVVTSYTALMSFTGDSNEFYKEKVKGELINYNFKELQKVIFNNENCDIILIGVQNQNYDDFFIPDSNYNLIENDCLVFITYEYISGDIYQYI